MKLYTSSDDPAAVAGYDQEYFKAILATMQLTPENAVDTPASASAHRPDRDPQGGGR